MGCAQNPPPTAQPSAMKRNEAQSKFGRARLRNPFLEVSPMSEQVFHNSFTAIRFGADELQEPAPVSWICQGILAAGHITLLTSQWKSGKTTLLSLLLGCRRA